MNIFFNKALHYLDKGQYMEGEKLLNQAIESSENKYEVIEIQACRAELLYEMGKYVEAEKCINYVLENTSEERIIPVTIVNGVFILYFFPFTFTVSLELL